MPAAARKGDMILTGHACDMRAPIDEGSPDVLVNGLPLSFAGAPIAPHTIKAGQYCIPHTAFVNAGSGTVFVNGKPVARVGDSADMGAIELGSADVIVGD